MKKALTLGTLLIAFGVLYTTTSLAQVKNLKIGYSEPSVTGDINDLIEAHVTLINTSSSSIESKVKRIDKTIPAGHVTYFCYQICYSDAVEDSPDPVAIAAGDSTEKFKSYFDPLGTAGNGQVVYSFYNAANPSDSVILPISYSATDGTAGIKNINYSVLSAYPNPASSIVHIAFPAGQQSIIRMYDVTGKLVAQQQLESGILAHSIATTHLKNGVYSLVATDNAKVAYTKVVITN